MPLKLTRNFSFHSSICLNPVFLMATEPSRKAKMIKAKVIKGLAQDWEGEADIREHLAKKEETLFKEGQEPSLKKIINDHTFALLKVVLERTAQIPKHPLAQICDLRDQISKLYEKCSIQASDSTIINDSWCLRKHMSWIKMKVRKSKPSTAAWICKSACIPFFL